MFDIFCVISLILIIIFWPDLTGTSCDFLVDGILYENVQSYYLDSDSIRFYVNEGKTKVVSDSYVKTCN